MRKNQFIILIVTIPLSLIFLAFFNSAYISLVKKSMLIFIALSIPYCLSVKDPRKGLLLFLLQASLLEGPWKHFTYGTTLKLLVYIIRDLLLYLTFFNFLRHRRRILPEAVLRQHPPYQGFIFIFLLNVAIQIFNPANLSYVSAVAATRMFWEMIPLYWMGFYLMRDKASYKVLFWVAILSLFLNSIAAILQYNWGWERVSQISEGYYAVVFIWGRGTGTVELGRTVRPTALGSDMGFAGIYFMQTLGMLIALFIMPQAKKLIRRLLILIFLTVLSLVNLAGMIASASRTAVVGTCIFLIVFFLIRGDLIRRRFIKIFIVSILLLFLIIPHFLQTFRIAARRYETIRTPAVLIRTIVVAEKGRIHQAFIMPLEYSIKYFLGNGLGKSGPGASLFGKALGETNAENTLNLSITEIGTIGTFLWVIFHILIVRRGVRIFKDISNWEWKWYATIPFSYMAVILIYWQFGHMISFPQSAGFWFMAGSLMGLGYISTEKEG